MTSYRTPLFFAQAVGRVVRTRGRHESATVFLPAVRPLLALAAELEDERNHVIPPPYGDGGVCSTSNRSSVSRARGAVTRRSMRRRSSRTCCTAAAHSSATSCTAEDEEFSACRGMLSAEQTAMLLAQRDAAARSRAAGSVASDDAGPSVATWRAAAELRREVNRLVSVVAARAGQPHAQIHAQLRRAVPGPPSASASAELLEHAVTT